MYQPYPSPGQVPQPGRPEPPRSVITAVRLMYVGAAISALGTILALVSLSSFTTTLRNADPSLTTAQISSFKSIYIGSAVVGGLIGIGLWVWMALANKAGKNWARIVSTVFFGIATLEMLYNLVRAEPAAGKIGTVLVWLVGLGAIVMLYRRESSEYFSAASAPRY
jgi:hypothetical protein